VKVPASLPRVPLAVTQGPPDVRDGIAVCRVFLEGRELPVTYRYKPGNRHDAEFRGYSIDGADVVFKTWGELAAAWPAYYASGSVPTDKELRSA
jgi:hypothetical protein